MDREGRRALVSSLAAHEPADEKEAQDLARIRMFVAGHDDPWDRRIPTGHLTGSALVLSADAGQVLLLHHRKLERWLQPGGHADTGESSGESVALREALEETGIERLALHPAAPRPLDVDVHDIPARPGEPAHQHLDLRYLVLAPAGAKLLPAIAELRDLRFFAWSDLGALDLDAGLRRALAKARAVAGA